MPPAQITLYHITHVDNLIGVINQGGLMANCHLQQCQIFHQSIAYDGIQDRRAFTNVPCGPGGTLHDYVPFYFAPRSPMLYTIHRGNVPGYSGGQTNIIYVISNIDVVARNHLKYVFTDGHGIMAMTEFYDDLNRLDEIDWGIMNSRYWKDTIDHPDRKRRRQAGFLVHKEMPWNCLTHIAVRNPRIQLKVESSLPVNGYRPKVILNPDWYY